MSIGIILNYLRCVCQGDKQRRKEQLKKNGIGIKEESDKEKSK